MQQVARNLHAAGHIRDGVTIEQAADIMWTYTAPQLYELLVLTRGWSLTRFAAFIADALDAALGPDS